MSNGPLKRNRQRSHHRSKANYAKNRVAEQRRRERFRRENAGTLVTRQATEEELTRFGVTPQPR